MILQYTHFSEDFKFAVIFPLVFLSTCVSSQWLSQTSDTLAPSLQITCPSKRSSIYQAEKTLETSLWAGKSILYVHLLLSSWRNGLIIEGNLQYDLYEFILPLPLSDLLRYIVLIHSFYHHPMAIKGKLLLFYYDQLWVVQYGETDSWLLMGWKFAKLSILLTKFNTIHFVFGEKCPRTIGCRVLWKVFTILLLPCHKGRNFGSSRVPGPSQNLTLSSTLTLTLNELKKLTLTLPPILTLTLNLN